MEKIEEHENLDPKDRIGKLVDEISSTVKALYEDAIISSPSNASLDKEKNRQAYVQARRENIESRLKEIKDILGKI